MKKRAVIFDMDGVLVDSEPIYLEFFRIFLRRNGKTPDEELLLRTVGSSNHETWRLLAQMWGGDCDQDWLEQYYYSSCADLTFSYQQAAFPQMRETVKELWERGLTLLIASASLQPSIDRMLQETGIAPYISHTVSGETVRRSKPDPDVYLQAIALSGFAPEECIAVEDSVYGIQAARSAGLQVVGVYSALFPETQALADFQIPSVAQLPALSFFEKEAPPIS